ncbi:hypothetical protein CC80DRAFT_509783 [Byssothecium circinans]|uniref:ABC transporter domain-containing protein n=1 Tax=Byssothecium circinans TaxID=147558 RepID=A0A6A5TI10_9PLEO|nr:hypothetical protein CC80DRAFT_509783 [Byssothecium circinans]
MTRREYVRHMSEKTLSLFNLSNAKNTPIGNATIRGISGGEKRRVTIAEAFLSFAPVQFWDNTTRGLDSATALFKQRVSFHESIPGLTGNSAVLRQSHVIVLYEGRQIFFGTWSDALDYFHDLGFERPPWLTTGDFLTALTNPPQARQFTRPDYIGMVPVTADGFATSWHQSIERQKILQQISDVCDEYRSTTEGLKELRTSRSLERHLGLGKRSPFTIPISQQIAICLIRGFQRLRNNLAVPISYVIGNVVMAAVVGSVFIDLGDTANDVTRRTVLLFFAVLINAFMSAQEV